MDPPTPLGPCGTNCDRFGNLLSFEKNFLIDFLKFQKRDRFLENFSGQNPHPPLSIRWNSQFFGLFSEEPFHGGPYRRSKRLNVGRGGWGRWFEAVPWSDACKDKAPDRNFEILNYFCSFWHLSDRQGGGCRSSVLAENASGYGRVCLESAPNR